MSIEINCNEQVGWEHSITSKCSEDVATIFKELKQKKMFNLEISISYYIPIQKYEQHKSWSLLSSKINILML